MSLAAVACTSCTAQPSTTIQDATMPYPVVAIVNASSTLDELYLAQYCGGVLVDATHVITASHCVENRALGTVAVVAGVTDLCDTAVAPASERSLVAARSSIPGAGPLVVQLTLASPLVAASQKWKVEGDRPDTAVALGWGRSSLGGLPSCELRQVDLRVVDPSHCAGLDDYQSQPPGSVLCTVPRTGVNTCSGDSGGPVYVFRERQVEALAIIESGAGCGSDAVGLNVRVLEFLD